MSEAKVIIERLGRCGVITLDRPAALNSLDIDMVCAIREALDGWEKAAALPDDLTFCAPAARC